MNSERARLIVGRMKGKRHLAAKIINKQKFLYWESILAYMDSGEFGKAAMSVLDSGVNDAGELADMIWEG